MRSEKFLIVLVCVLGVLAVAYGMARRNHPVFVVGLILIVGGYLWIRKRLKESLVKRSRRV